MTQNQSMVEKSLGLFVRKKNKKNIKKQSVKMNSHFLHGKIQAIMNVKMYVKGEWTGGC